MKKFLLNLLLGIGAGIAIGLGGTVNLAAKSLADASLGMIFGAFLFPLGLITVCVFGFFLYTGKIGYVFDNKPNYLLDLLAGLIGNLIGAELIGYICFAIPSFRDGTMGALAYNYASAKMAEPIYQTFLWSLLCGVFVFLGVDIYKRKGGVFGIIGIIVCTASFVLIGCEHCIANIYYYSASNCWNLETILNVLICVIGNSLGAILFRLLIKAGEKLQEPKAEESKK